MSNTLVTISNNFKTSTRVNDDAFDANIFLSNFIVHGSVQQLLTGLAAEVSGTDQRTFTVTGPYGSGKSTFAQYISCVLSEDSAIRESALEKLYAAAPDNHFAQKIPYVNGWCVVKHLCGLASPAQDITKSLLSALDRDVSVVSESDPEECIAMMKDALDEASKSHDGVLLIVDELGKALDFMARNKEDLYFFQAFADLAQKYDNVIVIGFLHQAFSAYADGMAASTVKEWSKIQGRYKDFGFNPSTDESMYLISKSFSVDPSFTDMMLSADHSNDTIQIVADEFKKGNRDTMETVLPIDPLTALLLGPISKRSFSQNERSLFSFIATHEKFGFRDFCDNIDITKSPVALYRTNLLWDYLQHNIGHSIEASADSQKWLEAVDAVERATRQTTELGVIIAKLVALVSLMGKHNELFASRQFIVAYIMSLPEYTYEEDLITSTIELLESKSIIIWRDNLNSFHVFRASDTDVNRLILDWRAKIENGIEWTETIQSQKKILANVHYHNTGVMRWANTQIISDVEQVVVPEDAHIADFVVLIIPTNPDLSDKLVAMFGDNSRVIIGSSTHMDELKSAALEKATLKTLLREEDELMSRDPIAKTEIDSRLDRASRHMDHVVARIFDDAQLSYMNDVMDGNTLTANISTVADKLYPLCPTVYSELINKVKLSGSSKGALNKLIATVFENATKPDLGFGDKLFPAERGIYLSCLEVKGMHTPTSMHSPFCGDWHSVVDVDSLPEIQRDAYVLWKAGIDKVKSSERVTVDDLMKLWMSQPYGITMGLSKLYAVALIKSVEENLAFYDFDAQKVWKYIPDFDNELLEKIYNRPQEVGFRFYEMTDMDTSKIRQIAAASGADDVDNILVAAKSLTRKLHSLPAWVKLTTGKNLCKAGDKDWIDRKTKKFRDVTLSASDPNELVFETIPSIFAKPDTMYDDLQKSISNLSNMDDILRTKFRTTLLDTLGQRGGDDMISRCEWIANNAAQPQLEAFAKGIAKYYTSGAAKGVGGAEKDFDALMVSVIGVRKGSWNDAKISNGYENFRQLLIQFRRYETFTRSGSQHDVGSAISLIVQPSKQASMEFEGYVANDDTLDVKVEKRIKAALKSLDTEARINTLLALLKAEMTPINTTTEDIE